MNAEEFARKHPELAQELTDTLNAAPLGLRIGIRPEWTTPMVHEVVRSAFGFTAALGLLIGLLLGHASAWWLLLPVLIGAGCVAATYDVLMQAQARRDMNNVVRREIGGEQR